MRDGIALGATVYRPNVGYPVPVITTATPYGKDCYHQTNNFKYAPDGSVPGGGGFYVGRLEFSDHTPFEAPDPGFWIPHGYAVVIVDLPGWGRSESNPPSTPGPEARWHDVMAWLGEQIWSTGEVGMSGVSALCATQWIAAKDPAPPQLKAIIAWEGVNESGPGGGYGGIPEMAFGEWMESVWLQPGKHHAECPRNALGASRKNARETVIVARHGEWAVDVVSCRDHREVREGVCERAEGGQRSGSGSGGGGHWLVT